MNPGATLVASLLSVLERPATWVLALAGFLIRGGLLLVLAPIIVLPSAIGLANILAPTLSSALLGGLTPTVLVLVVAAGGIGLAWIVGGGLIAAALEAESVRIVAGGEAGPLPRRGRDVAWRILGVRLLAAVPLAITLGWAATRVVAATYREFTVPIDTTVPLIVRVARAVPDALAAIALTWLLAEVLGALAARRIVLADAGIVRALGGSLGYLVRHPVRVLVAGAVPLLALALVVVPSAAAASSAWTAIRITLADGLPPLLTLVAILVLVAVWAGQLVLLGLVAAWRSATWTVEVAGTFGGVAAAEDGGWSPSPESGTLGDGPGIGTGTGTEGEG
ncbi:MAG: hypothetical protein ACLGIJ_03800 [Candidatus Limnocylindria bacterium]